MTLRTFRLSFVLICAPFFATAGEFDKPFFISLTGDWSGSGTLTANGNATPITPARVRAETKDDGSFTLEGDITIGGDLGFYSLTFREANGVITVHYANSDGGEATLNAFVDYAARTARIKGPEREFLLSLARDLLKVELVKTGSGAATAILNLKRE